MASRSFVNRVLWTQPVSKETLKELALYRMAEAAAVLQIVGSEAIYNPAQRMSRLLRDAVVVATGRRPIPTSSTGPCHDGGSFELTSWPLPDGT